MSKRDLRCLATQPVSRLRARFQIELPLRRFFEAPTVADVAVAIVAAGTPGDGTSGEHSTQEVLRS